VRGAAAHGDVFAGLRHFAYAAGWKKFEPLWDLVIRARRAGMMVPVLEAILSEFGRRSSARSDQTGHTSVPTQQDGDVLSHRLDIQPNR
jgi:hypothetical protein